MSDLKKSPIMVLLLANLAFSSFIAFNVFKQQNAHADTNNSNQQGALTQPAKGSAIKSASPTLSATEQQNLSNSSNQHDEFKAANKTEPNSEHGKDHTAASPAKAYVAASSAELASRPENSALKAGECAKVYRDPAEPSSEDINAVVAMAAMQSARPTKTTKRLHPTVDLMASSRPMRISVPPPPETSIFNAEQSLSKMDGISVTAVMGNRAMLKFERPGRRRHHEKPEVVCLAVGEHIRTPFNVSVAVVAVEPYRVTLDIDGDRFVKSLTEIR